MDAQLARRQEAALRGFYRIAEALDGVNAGVISGRRGGPKAGQWIGHADMERAPIGALSMSA